MSTNDANHKDPKSGKNAGIYKNWQNQYIELADTLPDYLLNCDEEISADALGRVLTRSSAYSELYLDIGTGSGNFVLESSKQNPTGYYFGVELRFKRAVRAAEKAKRAGLPNVFFFRTRAELLVAALADQSLAGVFVNFPDPWPKQRWAKHRLLREEFLTQIGRILKTDGFFKYTTDHSAYFEEVSELAKRISAFRIEHVKRELSFSDRDLASPTTEFGQLFESKNMSYNELLCSKR